VFVSFKDALWNPRRSQSSFTDGTLLSDTEGFDDGVIAKNLDEEDWVGFAGA